MAIINHEFPGKTLEQPNGGGSEPELEMFPQVPKLLQHQQLPHA
jgi:hypothetical protein